MNRTLSPLITAAELKQLHALQPIVLVDARTGKNAKSDYEAAHLDGALYVDLNTQLADIPDDFSLGGRHPLPQISAFAATLSELGISPESHVVVYDDKNGANAAARFWWMLRAVGHEKVQVLNGGLAAALLMHFPMGSGEGTPHRASAYPVTAWQLPTVALAEVEAVAQDGQHLVIDVREPARYKGIVEPIDLVAGHIPGAINVPFTQNLDENGLFLPAEVLQQQYETLFGSVPVERVIVHCGSGVTACHTLLAIAAAHLPLPKLYVGSWSEWSRNQKPIVRESAN